MCLLLLVLSSAEEGMDGWMTNSRTGISHPASSLPEASSKPTSQQTPVRVHGDPERGRGMVVSHSDIFPLIWLLRQCLSKACSPPVSAYSVRRGLNPGI